MPNSFTKAHRDEERNGACDASSVWWKDITSAVKFHWIASLVVRVMLLMEEILHHLGWLKPYK